MSAPRTARARVRAELTREILAAAHAELATQGAPGLSLRAVARRLEMVPSALYRYFPNRDALLTALIVDAYQAVADAAARADRGAGADCLDRWLAVTAAVRRWGQDHPHEWALVYGSPVPGYHAPHDTVAAALQVTTVLCRIFSDAVPPASPTAPPALPAGPPASPLLPAAPPAPPAAPPALPAAPPAAPPALPAAPPQLGEVLEPLQAALLPGRAPETVAAALLAWTQLFGMVSLELFGHFVGATTDFDVTFDYTMRVVARLVGLPGA